MKLLIADEVAGRYLEEVRSRFPQLDTRSARNADELAQSLADWSPDIAYSCVSHAFARSEHGILAGLAGLQWLHVGGSGFDHMAAIDLSRTKLTNGRGVLAPFQADMVIGGLLAINHGLLAHYRSQTLGGFQARTHPALAGQTLLVVGPGAIGSAVARKARCFGIECLAVARTAEPREHFDEVMPFGALHDALAKADIVSLHLPFTERTRQLIGAAEFAAMKPDSILINTARGGILDEPALIGALKAGKFRGVYLDVFAQEPLAAESLLRSFENVLITPHCADQVEDWQLHHARFFMDNLERWLDGKALSNVIQPQI